MDLIQRKLTKVEWDTTEIPVSATEKKVLELIDAGYENVNIKINHFNSLFSFLKIEYSKEMEDYLYNKYFHEKIQKLKKTYDMSYLTHSVSSNIQIKKADMIRLQNNTIDTIQTNEIYETVLLDRLDCLLDAYKNKNEKWQSYYFVLYKLIKNSVTKISKHVLQIIQSTLDHYEEKISTSSIVINAYEFIERNSDLLKYNDLSLYEHQKKIFALSKISKPKLLLYIAPTGTGKTLTPIGLAKQHKIIFVCAARHVGLALARSAISINKKIAFAFGCNDASDIRLHYFSAKEYTKNTKSGGIWKVDNSVGDKVEIIISDIKSYLSAMYYMLSFNTREEVITYWDEPTITMDYDSHEFHDIIQKNWTENLIPNMILSSATLPKEDELVSTISDFKNKFPDAFIESIISHDCIKSIPLINKNGYVVLPHNLYEDYDEVLSVVKHCENYPTLLRYFDLKEVCQFIKYVNDSDFIQNSYKVNRRFISLDDITMQSIKQYYLKILGNIKPGTWGSIYIYVKSTSSKRILPNNHIDEKGNKFKKSTSIGPGVSHTQKKIQTESFNVLTRINSEMISSNMYNNSPDDLGNSAIYITTKDAYTLTDGPTIFLANDVEKVAKFYIQQSHIPSKIMETILETIQYNNTINEKIGRLEKDMEDMLSKTTQNDQEDDGKGKKSKNNNNNKNDREMENNVKIKTIKQELEMLYSMVKVVNFNETFVPNKPAHFTKWAEEMDNKRVFTSNIDNNIIEKIMLLNNVSDNWKILLLMGIGVFVNHENMDQDYVEIMKNLADKQLLYLIIASSDYIYGTNYQFCHGYLSKDMKLTQEKIIQALGRIGRNNIQQDYSIRFRDNEQIIKLFNAEIEKPEIKNMNKLFCSL
jgi:hypothetical protein